MLASNPFWQFSLAVYTPPVAARLLHLQDTFGLNVNLLLYAVWLAQQGKGLDCSLSESGAWPEAQTRTETLRRMRRALTKTDDDLRPLRDSLQQAELDSEQYQQWLLYQRAAGQPDATRASIAEQAEANLVHYTEQVVAATPSEWCASLHASLQELVQTLVDELENLTE